MRSLQGRLLALVLGVVGSAWIAAAAVSIGDARHELDELLDGHLAQAAALLIAQQTHAADEDDTVDDAPPLHHYAPRVAFQVWHAGALTLRSANAPMQAMGSHSEGFASFDQDGARWRVFAARGGERDILVYVGERVDARASILRAVMRGMFLPLAVALPLLALLVWLAVRGGLAPLRRLASAVAAREPDADDTLRLPQPPTELGAVIGALNDLFGRIGRLRERERRFTADAAHELRTPIAAIAAQAQAALGAENDFERRHALESTLLGCERASRLVEQMLTLARLENPTRASTQSFDLGALARRIIAGLLPLADAKHQRVELDAPATCVVDGDEALLGVLLRNLVDNALRYSASGAQVAVAVERERGGWTLRVDDSGPGLDADGRARLGERFFRVLGSEDSGSGLGWSIVRRIAEVLRLQVQVEPSVALGGLSVRVHGPATTG